MTTDLFYNLTGAGLFLLGFLALFTQSRLLKKILSINISGAGLFLLMISTGYDPAGDPPDPVLQALVLTGIVIAVSITAFALALASRIEAPREEKSGPRPRARGADSQGEPPQASVRTAAGATEPGGGP